MRLPYPWRSTVFACKGLSINSNSNTCLCHSYMYMCHSFTLCFCIQEESSSSGSRAHKSASETNLSSLAGGPHPPAPGGPSVSASSSASSSTDQLSMLSPTELGGQGTSIPMYTYNSVDHAIIFEYKHVQYTCKHIAMYSTSFVPRPLPHFTSFFYPHRSSGASLLVPQFCRL